jgi:NADPH:quinone reductase-like Zn-dependent oxidoreductase
MLNEGGGEPNGCIMLNDGVDVSAAYGLVEDIDVPEGKYLLQTAAGSVLGRIVIALARRRDVKTINVVRRSEQKEELLLLG